MINITSREQFDKEIKNGKVIIDFYADWCGPCKMISPILEELEEEMDYTLVKVNTDNNKEIAIDFNVQGIPYVLRYEDGKKVDELVGFPGEDAVEKFVK